MDIEKPEWLLQMEGILETLNEGVMVSERLPEDSIRQFAPRRDDRHFFR